MRNIIIISSLVILSALDLSAAGRRHQNNPIVQCGQKIDKIKSVASKNIQDLANQTCLANPSSFDALEFIKNNPNAVCESKVRTGVLGKASAKIVQIGIDTCLKSAQAFNGEQFLKTNPEAVCERRVARLNSANARASMLELATERCKKVGVEFNPEIFHASFDFCDRTAKRMTSLWTGYRRKARHDCTLMDDPEKSFNEANFIRANVLPPQKGAAPKPTTDSLD